MSTYKLFFAGSGGQGILLMGQAVTYAAMYEDQEATFMPSYGPEMRGGTANCTVCVSEKPISCPLIYEADAVIAMNLPSLIKFESLVRPGGYLFRNTEIIDQSISRTDITQVDVDAGGIARELGNAKAANMVMLGALLRTLPVVKEETVRQVLEKTFTGKKAKLLDLNFKALSAWKG